MQFPLYNIREEGGGQGLVGHSMKAGVEKEVKQSKVMSTVILRT